MTVAECVRRAWLVLGGSVLALEDDAAGYACTELDLGYPEVREVMDNRPDQDGVDDRTRLMGSRAVTANIKTTPGGGASTPDEIATLFAPFMLPALRPELHYILDRPGARERVLTVRASGYAWPVSGSPSREIQLAWVASDPVIRDPATQSATAYAGTGGAADGRIYPLTHPRIYPPGYEGAPSTGMISSPGDVPVRPVFRIYGPITAPVVALEVSDPDPGPAVVYRLVFAAGVRIDAGRWLEVDTATKTATDDTGASVMSSVDWQATTWPALPVAPAVTYMTLMGSTTSHITQVVATWRDGYLT